jgi:hypothetical protein
MGSQLDSSCTAAPPQRRLLRGGGGGGKRRALHRLPAQCVLRARGAQGVAAYVEPYKKQTNKF